MFGVENEILIGAGALLLIYIPILGAISIQFFNRVWLKQFNRAVASATKDAVVSHRFDVATATEAIEMIFRNSTVKNVYKSPIEALEQIFLQVHGNQSRSLKKFWREDKDRQLLQELIAFMRQKMPYSLVSGEARKLLESVDASLTEDAIPGRNALSQLSSHISKNEDRLLTQTRLTYMSWGVSLVGIVVAILTFFQ